MVWCRIISTLSWMASASLRLKPRLLSTAACRYVSTQITVSAYWHIIDSLRSSILWWQLGLPCLSTLQVVGVYLLSLIPECLSASDPLILYSSLDLNQGVLVFSLWTLATALYNTTGETAAAKGKGFQPYNTQGGGFIAYNFESEQQSSHSSFCFLPSTISRIHPC